MTHVRDLRAHAHSATYACTSEAVAVVAEDDGSSSQGVAQAAEARRDGSADDEAADGPD